jgi:hypothetical protein
MQLYLYSPYAFVVFTGTTSVLPLPPLELQRQTMPVIQPLNQDFISLLQPEPFFRYYTNTLSAVFWQTDACFSVHTHTHTHIHHMNIFGENWVKFHQRQKSRYKKVCRTEPLRMSVSLYKQFNLKLHFIIWQPSTANESIPSLLWQMIVPYGMSRSVMC